MKLVSRPNRVAALALVCLFGAARAFAAEGDQVAGDAAKGVSSVTMNKIVNPVARYGLLKTVGRQVCDQSGNPVQLRGMSLFWSQWGGRFYNAAAVAWTANEWGATVIRIAMGVDNGGYLVNAKAETKRVHAMVAAAKKAGIYAIIDWHDHEAYKHRDAALAFFTEMATAYRDEPGVIFEIYNEPLQSESWASVKSYSEALIAAIRATGARQLILVGSPSWDQRLDLVAADPIVGQENIAYTMHFYAGTHGDELRAATQQALDAGLAVFCSEWGTCDANGNGAFAEAKSDQWMQFLDANGISWCNWAISDRNETSSALKTRVRADGGWQDKDLSASGRYVRGLLLAGAPALGTSR